MPALAGMMLMLAMMLPGIGAVRRWTRLGALEAAAYGSVLGAVAASLALVALASAFGWSRGLVTGVGIVAAVSGAGLLAAAPSRTGSGRELAAPIGAGVALILALFVLRWGFLASSALAVDARGLWAGHIHVWGDWSQHLGDVASFAYGENFPPSHPRFAGHPLSYHYLTSITVAAMVALGQTPMAALQLHTFVFLSLATLATFAFARRLTRDAPAAALALTLFLLGGGLGWTASVREALSSPDPWAAFWSDPWDRKLQDAGNFRWLNVVFAYLLPQRAVLYGLPLGLLSLTLLLEGGREGRTRAFVFAGVVAGLLPLAHLGTLLALALITPFLVLPFPRRGWLWFFLGWGALAAPVFLIQQGGGGGALSHIRLHPGWVAAPDPWWFFWLKNLGLFFPLWLWALARPQIVPPPGARFLWASVPVFAIANLVAFQPWPWDNTKVLLYWYLGACVLVAALLASWWRQRGPLARVAIAASVATLLLSGVFANLDQALGRDRQLMLTTQELKVAEEIRRVTPPHALFLTGLQHNHPVAVLSGRRIVMGYRGWMWTQGFPYRPRERDVRAMFALGPAGLAQLARYGVDYVVVGPWEREHLNADDESFRARYPRVVDLPPYAVYQVRRFATPVSASPDSTAGR